MSHEVLCEVLIESFELGLGWGLGWVVTITLNLGMSFKSPRVPLEGVPIPPLPTPNNFYNVTFPILL